MVTEDVQAAFAEQDQTAEQVNNTSETDKLRQQVQDTQQLIEQMNATQQQNQQVQQQQTYHNHLPFPQAPYQHPFFAPGNMYNKQLFKF